MTLVELRDRDELASFFRRRPEVHAYELGDLDDFFWPHTRWFGWLVESRLEQVALLYGEPDPPVLIALAEEYDPVAKRLVGNFPQAFTHFTLVDAALTLAGSEGRLPARRA